MTESHSFPDFAGSRPNYGFLGGVTDAPFDRLLLETTPGAQTAVWMADNIRYGDALTATAAAPEPGSGGLSVAALGLIFDVGRWKHSRRCPMKA